MLASPGKNKDCGQSFEAVNWEIRTTHWSIDLGGRDIDSLVVNCRSRAVLSRTRVTACAQPCATRQRCPTGLCLCEEDPSLLLAVSKVLFLSHPPSQRKEDMSFGFSPSDIVALICKTTKAYLGWKHACGSYADITGSLNSLQIILTRISNEARTPGTVLVRSKQDARNLSEILQSCESVVRELSAIVAKYRGLGRSRQKNWDRLRFGVKDLAGLKAKLVQHTTTISAYLDAVGLGSLSRIERELRQMNAVPVAIQQTVDSLVHEIRAGRREDTIMTAHENDETYIWRQFRRELISEGHDSDTIHRYKPQLKAYLGTLSERGELEEQPVSAPARYGFAERASGSPEELANGQQGGDQAQDWLLKARQAAQDAADDAGISRPSTPRLDKDERLRKELIDGRVVRLMLEVKHDFEAKRWKEKMARIDRADLSSLAAQDFNLDV